MAKKLAVAHKNGATDVAPKPVGRPPKPGGEAAPTRIDVDVLDDARILAVLEKTTITDLLSSILRPILRQRLDATGLKRPQAAEGAAQG